MNNILGVFELYADSDKKRIDGFNEVLESTMKVTIDRNSPKIEYDWIDVMYSTMPYLNNILAAPTRLIVSEEEVVKIEKIKKVTIESIKHLSKNSQFISEVEENGDVKPEKLLNVFKEETYNTYENRFIYTLILRMLSTIRREKQRMVRAARSTKTHEHRKMDYKGSSYNGREQVDVQIVLTASGTTEDQKNEMKKQLDRMQTLEKEIIALTYTNTFQTFEKEKLIPITPPLRKNNVILKNVNFQYATKLWDFLTNELEKQSQKENGDLTQEYMDKGKAKKYIDETFLLDYLVMRCVENPEVKQKRKKELMDKLVANMVESMIDLDEKLSEDQLKDIVAKQYKITKYKNQATAQEIQDIFKKYITKYVQKINA